MVESLADKIRNHGKTKRPNFMMRVTGFDVDHSRV
jgi:hypothetical protein